MFFGVLKNCEAHLFKERLGLKLTHKRITTKVVLPVSRVRVLYRGSYIGGIGSYDCEAHDLDSFAKLFERSGARGLLYQLNAQTLSAARPLSFSPFSVSLPSLQLFGDFVFVVS